MQLNILYILTGIIFFLTISAGFLVKKSLFEYGLMVIYTYSLHYLTIEILLLIMDATDVLPYSEFIRPIKSLYPLVLIPIAWFIKRSYDKIKEYRVLDIK